MREIIASRSLPLRSSPGEVPERLNGRDWKSRDGGNLVRGFESLPLRRLGAVAALDVPHGRHAAEDAGVPVGRTDRGPGAKALGRVSRSALRGRAGRVGSDQVRSGTARVDASPSSVTGRVVVLGFVCGPGWPDARRMVTASDEALTTRLDVCSSGVTDGGWRPTRARRAPICERRGVPPPRRRACVQLFPGLVLFGVSARCCCSRASAWIPWDVLHQGLSRRLGLGVGTWAIIVGVACCCCGSRCASGPGSARSATSCRRRGDRPRARDSCPPPHPLARADRAAGRRRGAERRRDRRLHRRRAWARARATA